MSRYHRLCAALAATFALGGLDQAAAQSADWPIHSLERPRPPVVDPGPAPAPAPVPADAIVLFDGTDLSKWQSGRGGPAGWLVRDGWFEVLPGTGSIRTADAFGDVQLHVEWSSPSPPAESGQDRGNSGVFLMGIYEVQVLDSYESDTYPDGQAAALYGRHPPLVNVSRPPGEWQTYDIVFRAPRFDGDGAVVRPARFTVLHNGVLVHDAVELEGPTAHRSKPPYKAHPDRLPIFLQDHGQAVRYRNIWLRELTPE